MPARRLLVMDITAGDGWEVLCPFLGVEIPDRPFPHENRTRRD
ncbi:MAG TPA: sulfotransferase [Pyrinomonadaceae bacterium]